MRRLALAAALVAALVMGAGCHDLIDGVLPVVCPTSTETNTLPARLSETGLYADLRAGTLAPGVRPYRPRFELWSDGAEKRRWLALPHGTQIDTTDPDDWRFPEGTRMWKEFTRDGVRVETRLIEKGATTWHAVAYVWLADGSDALATPGGYVDAHGTAHDVPAAGECVACHGGRASYALGVSAIQLGYDAPSPDLDLADLVASGALSRPLGPTFPLPGDDVAQRALGYLHANCGHCHHSAPGDRPCFAPGAHDFYLRHDTLASVEATPAFASAADAGGDMLRRMSSRSFPRAMPPLGTRIVDAQAVAAVRAWLESVP